MFGKGYFDSTNTKLGGEIRDRYEADPVDLTDIVGFYNVDLMEDPEAEGEILENIIGWPGQDLYPSSNGTINGYDGKNADPWQPSYLSFVQEYMGSWDPTGFEGATYLNLSNDFTISTWIYLNVDPTNPTSTMGSVILGVGQIDSGGIGLSVNSNSKIQLHSKFDGIHSLINISSSDVPAQKWCHLTITKNSEQVDFYLNGGYAGIANDAFLMLGLSQNGNLELGRRTNSNDNYTYASSSLRFGSLALYSRRLLNSEIRQNFLFRNPWYQGEGKDQI
jgi:hypothetical protein